MLKILLVAISLFTALSTHSQKKPTVTDTLRQNIAILNETIKNSNQTLKILNDRMTEANETINNQSSAISSFGVIYSILTIVFTLIGLLIPIVTYYFGIKPSREQIRNLESNFNQKLEEYLTNARRENTDKAINQLSSGSAELKQNAVTYLSLTQHEGFTEMQYFKLFKILTEGGIDSAQKPTLVYILTGKENDYATQYCKSILQSRTLYNEYIPARYFGMIGVLKYIQNFVDYLKNSPHKNDSFVRILSHMRLVSLDSVIDLFNSEEIIALFDKQDMKYLKANGLMSNFEVGFEEDRIKQTKLYKLVFEE